MNRRPVGLASCALLVAAVACGSSSTPAPVNSACNTNPWACPGGQTCWPSDTSGDFACFNSLAGAKKGDACQVYVGSPSCGDAMICYAAPGASAGTCVLYCDNTTAGRGCAAGEACIELRFLSGGTVHACIPYGATDAGTDSG